MVLSRSAILPVLLIVTLTAQESVRPKDVREIAKKGSNAIPQLQEFLKHPDLEVRLEAVKQIVEIGTQHSLGPLLQATADNDPEVQIRATDGLVNFYLPGYVESGFGASLRRAGTSIKGRFTDTNDQVIPGFVQVRPDIVSALGKLARGGALLEARANAARAIGILRGAGAIPDLLEALRSKDSTVIYECLVALQKIQDQSAAPKISFLLRDLDEKVQIAAIETTGLLQNKSALPDLMEVLKRADARKVRRAALTAIAMLPEESSRSLYATYLRDKDERMRAAAAEGFARLKKPTDLPLLEKAWEEEGKTPARLSLAFAQVMLGKQQMSEFSPLQYLVNTLNSKSYQGEAYAFLVELARDPTVRRLLYPTLGSGTKDEKIYLARVMARSGDKETVPYLEKLSKDTTEPVAQEGLRALRTLQARL